MLGLLSYFIEDVMTPDLPEQEPNDLTEQVRGSVQYLHLGMQIGISFLVFVGLGYWADQWLHTRPWLMLAGAAFGLVSMITLLYKVLQEMGEHDRERASRKPKSS